MYVLSEKLSVLITKYLLHLHNKHKFMGYIVRTIYRLEILLVSFFENLIKIIFTYFDLHFPVSMKFLFFFTGITVKL